MERTSPLPVPSIDVEVYVGEGCITLEELEPGCPFVEPELGRLGEGARFVIVGVHSDRQDPPFPLLAVVVVRNIFTPVQPDLGERLSSGLCFLLGLALASVETNCRSSCFRKQ